MALRRRRPRRVRRVRRVRRGRRGGRVRARRAKTGRLQKNINTGVTLTDTVTLVIPPNQLGQFATNGLQTFFIHNGVNVNYSPPSTRIQLMMSIYQYYRVTNVTYRFIQRATTFVASGTNVNDFASKPYVYLKMYKEIPISLWANIPPPLEFFRKMGCVGRPWGRTNLNIRFKPYMYNSSLLYDVHPNSSVGSQIVVPAATRIESMLNFGMTTPLRNSYYGQYTNGLTPQSTRSTPRLNTHMFLANRTPSSVPPGGSNYKNTLSNGMAASGANDLDYANQDAKAPLQYGPYFYLETPIPPVAPQDAHVYTVECRITVHFSKARIIWDTTQTTQAYGWPSYEPGPDPPPTYALNGLNEEEVDAE